MISKANLGSGPSGNQYLVCLCPNVLSQSWRHSWLHTASTSVCIIALGGSGESGSEAALSLALEAASSAVSLPRWPACPLTHLRTTCVSSAIDRLLRVSIVSIVSLDFIWTALRALRDACESEYIVTGSPLVIQPGLLSAPFSNSSIMVWAALRIAHISD